MPTYTTYTVPPPESHKYPEHYKVAPLIDDRKPIEIKVIPAQKFRGPPDTPVRYLICYATTSNQVVVAENKINSLHSKSKYFGSP